MTKATNMRLAKFTLYFLSSICVATAVPSKAQLKPGCRDKLAKNYNATATVNDKSCLYDSTGYDPTTKANPMDPLLVESSGLQWAGNALWTFNDGSGAAAIYRIDTSKGLILQTVNIDGATNVDWEDIAFDGTYMYIGDFGNNANGARKDLKIYKFLFSLIPPASANKEVTIDQSNVTVINFSYATQTDFTPRGNNNTKYDCEAMIVDRGKIHLFSKNWINLTSTHYVLRANSGSYIADSLETLATGYLVTGADKAPNKNVVALLGYQTTFPAYHFIHILSDYKGGLYFNGNTRRIDLNSGIFMGQAEGITFMNDNYGFISGEKLVTSYKGIPITVNQMLKAFDLSAYMPPYLTSASNFFRTYGSGNWFDEVTWQSSPNNTTWATSTSAPDARASAISIQDDHEVVVDDTIAVGSLTVAPKGALTLNSQLTSIGDSGIVFTSDAAAVGRVGTSAAGITGNVVINRFYPARRAWRLVASPVGGNATIYNSWQEAKKNVSGLGTQITGNGVANGFDQSPNSAPSIKYYDAANSNFLAINGTNVPITSHQGYFLFVRGDRSIDLSQGTTAAPTSTTLRQAGTVRSGDQSLTVAANVLTLAGNPFISPVDFANMSKTNMPDRFYLWDPKRASVGAYVLFEGPDYMPLNNGGSYSGANSIIETGQAFFVQGSENAGTLTITEASKKTTQRNAFRTAGVDSRLQVNLYVKSSDTLMLADATQARYNTSYSAAVTAEDALKPDNIYDNIAIVRDNRMLTVERRPLIAGNDSLFLNVYNLRSKAYSLEVIPTNFSDSISATLEDKYLNTHNTLSLTTATRIPFSVTDDSASTARDRFRIVYASNMLLPLQFVSLKGVQQGNSVQLECNVENCLLLETVELQKSADGRSFEVLKSVTPTTAVFTAIDSVTASSNFYRVKTVSKSGQVSYSSIILVKAGKLQNIGVYPNPVVGHAMNLQLNNQQPGTYLLQLYAQNGQLLFQENVVHAGRSSTQSILVPSPIKGTVQMKIAGPGVTTMKTLQFK